MGRTDPLDLLSDLDPHRGPAELPEAAFLDRVLATALADDARRRKRRRRIGTAAISVASLAAAAAAWVLAQDADDPDIAVCYAEPSLAADVVLVSFADGDPIGACLEHAWSPGQPFHTPSDPPPLRACVNRDGAAAVFPADAGDPCEALGLAPLEPDRPAGADPDTTGLAGRIAQQLSGRCVPLPEAEARVRAELDRSGLNHWDVVVTRPTSPEEPCASASVDVPEETILLVPIPRNTD